MNAEQLAAAVDAGARAWHTRDQESFAGHVQTIRWEDLDEDERRTYLARSRDVVLPALVAGGVTIELVEDQAPHLDATRPLPGGRQPCDRCGSSIVWARTVAGPNGSGGKAMPLDAVEDPRGNVAVQPGHGRQLRARVLGKDEHHSPPVEFLAMPHFATCRRT